MLRLRRPPAARRARRGSALILVLVFTLGLGALALSAIFMNGSAAMLSRAGARENDLRMSAEASLHLVKSYLNADPAAMPDSGFREFVLPGATLTGADGAPMEGTTVRVWFGPSGITQNAVSFATIIAEARDAGGARHVRRLDTARESFAKFAYFTNVESATGGTIYFTAGDVLFGPVWSNDVINVAYPGGTKADFRDSVFTARTISGASNGTFRRGYFENRTPIALPSTSSLARMRVIAAQGGLALSPPAAASVADLRARLEFVAVDLNGDGDSTDVNEGFVRVYESSGTAPNGRVTPGAWVRGDWEYGPTGTSATDRAQRIAEGTNCGDFHVDVGGPSRFFPMAVHDQPWFRARMISTGVLAATIDAHIAGGPTVILGAANARCFLGGDPHLVAIAEPTRQVGGDTATWYPGTAAAGSLGRWLPYTGPVAHPRLAARRDAGFLHPINRALDARVRGVIDVAGTIGLSGVVNGRVTVHTSGSMVILDDLVYATRPGAVQCDDMLGLVANREIVVADNAILTPIDHDNNGVAQRVMKTVPHLWVNGVVMALDRSFRVENFDTGPTNALACGTVPRGRGCLNLDGGIIQDARGAVGTSIQTGYLKRYTYDRCAASDPPPYFPTTGRFTDNAFTEIDPVAFDVAALFQRITPR